MRKLLVLEVVGSVQEARRGLRLVESQESEGQQDIPNFGPNNIVHL